MPIFTIDISREKNTDNKYYLNITFWIIRQQNKKPVTNDK